MIRRAGLVLSLTALQACGGPARDRDRVRPRPGAPRLVTLGVLAQLTGSMAYVLATTRTKTEPEEMEVAIGHLAAAFYGWPDPDQADVQQFLVDVCARRLALQDCRGPIRAALAVLEAAAEDGLRVCRELSFSDKYRRNLLQSTCRRLRRQVPDVPRLAAWVRGRWQPERLPQVPWCRRDQHVGPRVELRMDRLVVRGMEVASLRGGELAIGAGEAGAIQSMLLAGLPEAGDATAGSGDATAVRGTAGAVSPAATRDVGLLLRADARVPVESLARMLRLAAEVNIRLAYLRVRDSSNFTCVLPLRLSTIGNATGPVCRLDAKGVSVCRGPRCEGTDSPERACRQAAWELRGGTVADLARVAARVEQATGRPILMWLQEHWTLTGPRLPKRAPEPPEPEPLL